MEVLAQLRDLPPAEARQRLQSLARAQGAAALELLRAALADPALAEAALEALAEVPAQESWDLLEQTVQSAAPRLRSRGLQPPPPTPRPEPAPAVEQARATPFDMTGNQLLRLVRPAALGMAHYVTWIVGPEGLVECEHAQLNRAELADILDKQVADLDPNLIEVGLAYVARRARTGAAHRRAAGKALPRDWPAAARLLQDAPEDPLPPELADVDREKALTPREAARLLRHQTMERWRLAPQRLMPYAEEWLHLLQYQPPRTAEGLTNLGSLRAQGQLTARIIADLGDTATLRRLVEQLAEQARLFHVLGEHNRAGLALRGSADLERHPGPDNPFLHALVAVSMELVLRLLQEEAAAAEEGPWVPAARAAGPLWVPRPAAPEADEEEKPAPRLWLPGQP